jgi:hypothetical protein
MKKPVVIAFEKMDKALAQYGLLGVPHNFNLDTNESAKNALKSYCTAANVAKGADDGLFIHSWIVLQNSWFGQPVLHAMRV